MVAGAFAFMPVQEASTVHTTGATTLGADAITEAKIANDAIAAEHIAGDAIVAATLAADVTTEITAGLMTVKEAIFVTADATTITAEGTSPFMVEFYLSDLNDADALLSISLEGVLVHVITSATANVTNCVTIGSNGGAANTITALTDDGSTAATRASAVLIGQIGDATLDLT